MAPVSCGLKVYSLACINSYTTCRTSEMLADYLSSLLTSLERKSSRLQNLTDQCNTEPGQASGRTTICVIASSSIYKALNSAAHNTNRNASPRAWCAAESTRIRKTGMRLCLSLVRYAADAFSVFQILHAISEVVTAETAKEKAKNAINPWHTVFSKIISFLEALG